MRLSLKPPPRLAPPAGATPPRLAFAPDSVPITGAASAWTVAEKRAGGKRGALWLEACILGWEPGLGSAHPSGARSVVMATSGHLVNGADGPVTTSGGSSCPCHPPEQPPREATSVPQA
ncbi:hypothetical protein MG293_017828 [Ovis ammon polii]|uniref:Uncharacterized protein n=1 Tax=Ovis ammon polii TaxID=230172 RepID=A0AAD4TQJ7_OVIAM|nr:hypothetical protein MG293_017828 [Ovis ammon polii]